MERMNANAKVERVLARRFRHILVRANASSFQRLRRQLFVFIRDKVGAEGEVIDRGTLTAKIENADLKYNRILLSKKSTRSATAPTHLRVGHTTVVPRLGIWLVLAVTIAASGTTTHC